MINLILWVIYKIKYNTTKEQVKKQIKKVVEKPMMYDRKGTRELYIKPFRLSYIYGYEAKIAYILDLYHKDKQ